MARGANSSETSAERKRRLKWGALPQPAPQATLGWGKRRDELKGVTAAELTRMILGSDEFEQVLGPRLDEIDARVTGKRGHPVRWQARQLEAVLVYRRVSGLATVKRTRERLTFDKAGRLLLGFGEDIPSEPTVSRYIRKHFDEATRSELMKELERRLRFKVAQLPGFADEAKILGMDGSKVDIRYTPPIPEFDKKGKPTGRIVNEDKITAPEAGFIGSGAGDHAGKGFQLVAVVTEHGTPLAWEISKLNQDEYSAGSRVLGSYEREILPRFADSHFSVLSADAGFHSNAIHRQLQSLRIVPNIHGASHAERESSQANAAKLNRSREPLHDPLKPHYANWFVNGHYELNCQCGAGRVERSVKVKNGRLQIATVGRCLSCGNVRVTAGNWRRVQNPTRWVRCMPGEISDHSYFGNPLTFNDKVGQAYGDGRFSWGESFHATMSKRFGLLKENCWLRRKAEVETEFAIAFSAIHSLVMERQRRLAKPPPATAPPPQARAA
jgi:hypothetical protein